MNNKMDKKEVEKVSKWWQTNFMILTLSLLSSVSFPLAHAQTYQSGSTLYSFGSSGEAVRDIQSKLAYIGYFKGQPTGFFSWQMYWSVKDFQRAFGLQSDGIVGPLTMAALQKATSRSNHSAIVVKNPVVATTAPATPTDFGGFSANDINLISHVVYGEARNQPFEGEVAVAAVILNRYHNSKFPHSISGIIFQPGAFTSISNGQAWVGANQTSKSAVLDAIHGWDPTHGALYYWNPATATSSWVWGQPILLRIGNHVFAK